jgi:hypothetical protein
MEIVDACGAASRLPRRLHGRQQQAHQRPQHGDHDQQLD